MYPQIEIGKITISTYALCIVFRIIVSGIVFALEIKKILAFRKAKVIRALLAGLMFGFLGAWLWDNFAHFLNGEGFGNSGISFMGGAILGISAFYLVLLLEFKDKLASKRILNAAIPSLVLGHMFGRIGCLFAGCCYGLPSKIGIGLVYPAGSSASLAYGEGTILIPTQIYEAMFLLILFILLLFVFKEKRIMIYLCSYGVYRFFGEMIRGDNRGYFLRFLTPSQFLSIIFVGVGVVMYIITKREKRKEC